MNLHENHPPRTSAGNFRAVREPSAPRWRLAALAFAVALCLGLWGMPRTTRSATPDPVNVGTAAAAPPPPTLVCDKVVDDFSMSPVGGFPAGWKTRTPGDLTRAKKDRLYVVEQDGPRRVLHATDRGQSVTIYREAGNWDAGKYSWLQWQWKAGRLPVNGREDDSDTNDSAAAVYLIWKAGFFWQITSFKYTWSTLLTAGTRFSRRAGHTQYHVIDSGKAHLNTWRTVLVPWRDDYAKYREVKQVNSPVALAVLTDGDDTDSIAEAYYADFRLCRKGP